MKIKIFAAAVICMFVSGSVMAETREEALFKKIPALAGTYNDTAKNLKKYEDMLKEIDKETKVLMKTYMATPDEGKEMSPEEAMAKFGGMGQGMSMTDIQLVAPLQEGQMYLNSEYLNYIQKVSMDFNKLEAELDKELDKVRKKFESEFNKVNDGEGSTAADVKKWNQLSRDYVTEQVKVMDSFIPKRKKILDEYKGKVTELLSKTGSAYSKAFSSTKNNTVVTQAASLRTNVLASLNDYIERHTAVAAWKPEDKTRK